MTCAFPNHLWPWAAHDGGQWGGSGTFLAGCSSAVPEQEGVWPWGTSAAPHPPVTPCLSQFSRCQGTDPALLPAAGRWEDMLPAGGYCLSSQPRRCWRRAANYSFPFNDFWTCRFVTCCLAPFSRCLLGYLCIQVRQAGSGEAARLQAALLGVATLLVPIQG